MSITSTAFLSSSEISGPDTEIRKLPTGKWANGNRNTWISDGRHGGGYQSLYHRRDIPLPPGTRITSVMVRVLMDGDNELFVVSNFHADGTDNEEILALFGLTPEEFAIAAREQLSPMPKTIRQRRLSPPTT